jgi:hypothetical protein
MRNRRTLRRVLGLSVLAVPVGVVWAYCGLAECDRADCGAVLNALFYTSGIGLLLALLGVIGSCVSGVALMVTRFRRSGSA